MPFQMEIFQTNHYQTEENQIPFAYFGVFNFKTLRYTPLLEITLGNE